MSSKKSHRAKQRRIAKKFGDDFKPERLVFTDASFCQRTKCAGWGVLIESDSGNKNPTKEFGIFKNKPETCGKAELYAIMNGIKVCQNIFGRDQIVRLHSDCIPAINLIRNHSKEFYYLKNKLKLDWFCLRVEHVNGHIEHPAATKEHKNINWCDRAARKMMEAERSLI